MSNHVHSLQWNWQLWWWWHSSTATCILVIIHFFFTNHCHSIVNHSTLFAIALSIRSRILFIKWLFQHGRWVSIFIAIRRISVTVLSLIRMFIRWWSTWILRWFFDHYWGIDIVSPRSICCCCKIDYLKFYAIFSCYFLVLIYGWFSCQTT